MKSDQEEADRQSWQHAADATACGATNIDICSPETNVLVLAIGRYTQNCAETQTVSRGQETGNGRITRQSNSAKYMMHVDQRKQQHW